MMIVLSVLLLLNIVKCQQNQGCRQLFYTSKTTTGAFGGTAGADRICTFLLFINVKLCKHY
jgi:hypothetical protein